MKKQIIAGIGIIACVAMCAAVWQRSDEVEDLPAVPVKNAVSAEIEARSEDTPPTFISVDMSAPETEAIAESEPKEAEVTAEKETEKPAPTPTAQPVNPAASSSEPRNGDVRVVDGERQIYLLGFGWIVGEGGGSVCITVGNPGDQLTGNRVGIMGGGTVAEDMYENGNKIGIIDGGECPSSEPASPPAEPEYTSDVIYIELQPPVTKDSTPPAYKPNGEPYNPRS